MNDSTSALTYSQSFHNGLHSKYARVAGFIRPGDRVLELGCADGYFGQALNAMGASVLGVENNKQFAEHARARGVEVVSCDLDDAAAVLKLNGKFNFILAMDVLEHLKDPKLCLASLHSKLEPNGRLLVTGPNVAYWAVRLSLLMGNWQYEKSGILDETHLRFYTISTWRELLESTGYQVRKVVAAETGMFPKQQWIETIFGKKIVKILAEKLTRMFPKFFSIVFFLDASTKNLTELE